MFASVCIYHDNFSVHSLLDKDAGLERCLGAHYPENSMSREIQLIL